MLRRRFGAALTLCQSLWMATIAVLSKPPESAPCPFSLLSSIQFPDEVASLPPSSCLVGRHRLVLTLPLSYLGVDLSLLIILSHLPALNKNFGVAAVSTYSSC
jgi:hypothetical protein